MTSTGACSHLAAVTSVKHANRHECEAPASRAEFRTVATHARMVSQELESLDDFIDEAVSSCGAGVLCDVGVDLVEVPLGESGQLIGYLMLRYGQPVPRTGR